MGIARKGSMIVVDKEEEILKSGLDTDFSLSLPSLVSPLLFVSCFLSLPHSFSFTFCGQWDGTGGTGGTGGSVHT